MEVGAQGVHTRPRLAYITLLSHCTAQCQFCTVTVLLVAYAWLARSLVLVLVLA
jgi:hypothetical protein